VLEQFLEVRSFAAGQRHQTRFGKEYEMLWPRIDGAMVFTPGCALLRREELPAIAGARELQPDAATGSLRYSAARQP
jgi:hypothetical protein